MKKSDIGIFDESRKLKNEFRKKDIWNFPDLEINEQAFSYVSEDKWPIYSWMKTSKEQFDEAILRDAREEVILPRLGRIYKYKIIPNHLHLEAWRVARLMKMSLFLLSLITLCLGLAAIVAYFVDKLFGAYFVVGLFISLGLAFEFGLSGLLYHYKKKQIEHLYFLRIPSEYQKAFELSKSAKNTCLFISTFMSLFSLVLLLIYNFSRLPLSIFLASIYVLASIAFLSIITAIFFEIKERRAQELSGLPERLIRSTLLSCSI